MQRNDLMSLMKWCSYKNFTFILDLNISCRVNQAVTARRNTDEEYTVPYIVFGRREHHKMLI